MHPPSRLFAAVVRKRSKFRDIPFHAVGQFDGAALLFGTIPETNPEATACQPIVIPTHFPIQDQSRLPTCDRLLFLEGSSPSKCYAAQGDKDIRKQSQEIAKQPHATQPQGYKWPPLPQWQQ